MRKKFSQHKEDIIIEFIIKHLINPQKTFLEIGYGHNGENNTLNLSINHNWTGVGIDAKPQEIKNPDNVKILTQTVTLDSIDKILNIAGKNIDFFSIDIDSFDFWLTVGLLDKGLFPKFVCVEILNSAGNYISVAPPYKKDAKYNKHYICGASIQAWKKFWNYRGYKFLTLDSSGINAFFYKPEFFSIGIESYPSIDFIKSKRNIPFSTWYIEYSKEFSIKDSIIFGNETYETLLHQHSWVV